jgi:hypothetical protein
MKSIHASSSTSEIDEARMDDQRRNPEGGEIRDLPFWNRATVSVALVWVGLLVLIVAGTSMVHISSDAGAICFATAWLVGSTMIGAGLFHPFKAAPIGIAIGFYLSLGYLMLLYARLKSL